MSIATSSILHDDPMQRVISALKSRGQTEHKDGLWSCPVCGRAKQLSVGMTDDGSKVMVHCFRKCDTKQILDSVGLKFADLYTNLIWTTDRVNTLLQQEYEVTQKELDSYDAMVASEVLRMHVKEQAKRDYRQFYGSGNTYPRILETSELENLPDAEWLIKGVLEKGVIAFLVGFTGTGKSFLALDWSMSVATGKSWLGRTTEQQAVLYVPGEGSNGYKKRARAWKLSRGRSDLSFMKWASGAVQIMDDTHLDGLISDVRSFGIRLVVIDTLSTCFVGYDQKDDMASGMLFERLKRVRDAIEPFGTTVLVIHHTGWNDKDRSRGSSDFKSSTDAEYVLTAVNEKDFMQGVQLTITKLKDDEAGLKIGLVPEKVTVGANANGEEITSVVLNESQLELTAGLKPNDPRKTDQLWRHEHLRTYPYEDRDYTLKEIMETMNSCRSSNDQLKSSETVRRDLDDLKWQQSTGARNVKLYRKPA